MNFLVMDGNRQCLSLFLRNNKVIGRQDPDYNRKPTLMI